jgi:hypothetical protein
MSILRICVLIGLGCLLPEHRKAFLGLGSILVKDVVYSASTDFASCLVFAYLCVTLVPC